jgi:hypothetical protein
VVNLNESEHLGDIGGYGEMDWACADWMYERRDRTFDGLF